MSMPIFEVRILESVNYNMDKHSILWAHKSEKRKNRGIWCGSPRYYTQYLGSQNIRLIFRGQQRNHGMVLKVGEYPPGLKYPDMYSKILHLRNDVNETFRLMKNDYTPFSKETLEVQIKNKLLVFY